MRWLLVLRLLLIRRWRLRSCSPTTRLEVLDWLITALAWQKLLGDFIPIEAGGTYKLTGLCLQPTTYFVKEEPANKRQEAEFVPGKLLTRFTSSIDQVQGTLTVGNDGTLTFKEEDGLDFQAITIQLPGGEQVPFLFTIKELVASSDPGVVAINTSTDLKATLTFLLTAAQAF